MTVYNILYFFVWVLGILSYSKGVKRTYIYYIQSSIIVLFAALRFQTGYDWPVYQSYYYSPLDSSVSFEVGFVALVSLFRYIGLSFTFFTFLCSCFQLIIIVKVIKFFFPKQCVLILAIMFSLADFYLIPSFSLMRQGFAVSIFLYGLMSYHKNANKKAVVYFFISALFHMSSIPIIGITYFLLKVRVKRNAMMFIFLLALVAYLTSIDIIRFILSLVIPIFGNKYEIYMVRDTYNASILYRVVFSGVSIFSFWLIYKFGCGWRDVNGYGIMNYALMAVIFPLVLYAYPTISTRYQYFYAIFLIGLCVNALDFFKVDNLIVILFISAILFYIPFYRFLTDPLSIVYIPYQNVVTYNEFNSTGTIRTNELLSQLYQLWGQK